MMKSAFVFSGQGAQSVGMGRDLFELSPAAKKVFSLADSVLGWSVSDICFNGPAEQLTGSKCCQPAIYTMSMACLAAFQERCPGLSPSGVAGLSLGEYAALVTAGVLSFEDGLRLVAKRGALMDEACLSQPCGGMASILGGNDELIASVCDEIGIDVANYNCPGQTVISGPKELVEAASAKIKEGGAKRVIPLSVAGAFHSRMMKSAGDGLAKVLENVRLSAPMLPVAQNVTGTIVSDPDAIRSNLVAQVAGSVRWIDCVRSLVDNGGVNTVIEFGPGSVVTGLVRKINSELSLFNIASSADLDRVAAELQQKG